jgi:hypothetical protein
MSTEEFLVRLLPWVVAALALGSRLVGSGRWVGRLDASSGEYAALLAGLRSELRGVRELFEQTAHTSMQDRARMWTRIDSDHAKHKQAEQKLFDDALMLLDRLEARLKEDLHDLRERVDRLEREN